MKKALPFVVIATMHVNIPHGVHVQGSSCVINVALMFSVKGHPALGLLPAPP
jgi:hypothetical protein